MHNEEWKEILDRINFQGFRYENLIERIKEKLLTAGHQNIYRQWKGSNFNVNHLFALQSEHINGECTLLHLATGYGLIRIVEALLKIGAKAKAKDQDDATPLHWAIISGNVDVVEVLLKNGAHVNAVNQDKESPLHFAVKFNNKDIINALLQKDADPSSKNKDGLTPINLAYDDNIKQLLHRAKRRQLFRLTVIIGMVIGVITTTEAIVLICDIAQGNFPIITISVMLMLIALVTLDCAIAHEALEFDADELSIDEPNTETSEIQIEENCGIAVSTV